MQLLVKMVDRLRGAEPYPWLLLKMDQNKIQELFQVVTTLDRAPITGDLRINLSSICVRINLMEITAPGQVSLGRDAIEGTTLTSKLEREWSTINDRGYLTVWDSWVKESEAVDAKAFLRIPDMAAWAHTDGIEIEALLSGPGRPYASATIPWSVLRDRTQKGCWIVGKAAIPDLWIMAWASHKAIFGASRIATQIDQLAHSEGLTGITAQFDAAASTTPLGDIVGWVATKPEMMRAMEQSLSIDEANARVIPRMLIEMSSHETRAMRDFPQEWARDAVEALGQEIADREEEGSYPGIWMLSEGWIARGETSPVGVTLMPKPVIFQLEAEPHGETTAMLKVGEGEEEQCMGATFRFRPRAFGEFVRET